MKFTNIKYIAFVLLLVGVIGCDSVTNSFTDGYNENPNNPTTAPADKIFVAGQVGAVTFLESHSARKGSMWAQYFSGEDRQYSSIYSYNLTASDSDSDWFMAYVRGLTNLRLAREKYNARTVVPESQVAATKIWEAMLMGQVTALWGDVPFSEAVNSDETSTPSYDSQSAVYSSVQTLLDEAITTLEANSSTISNDVTSLNGDASKWLKVAYTLKARYLMHTGDASGALTAAQNGIDADDGSGDALMPHGQQQARNQNLYYAFTVVERSGYLAADRSHSRDMLNNGNNSKTDETARVEYFYDGTDLNNTDGFAAASESFPLVTYLENQMIIAEAEAAKGTATGDQNAIEALNNSRDYLDNKFGTDNYDDLLLTDFQAGGAYENTTIPQHVRNWTYLGLIGQIEGFNFVRRIDYNVDGLSAVQGSEFPQRFLYPQDERNTNGDNLPDPVPGLFDPTPVNQ